MSLETEFKDACNRAGGRIENMKENTGNTVQCITDDGKLDIDQDNRSEVPTKARGQSITSNGSPPNMQGTLIRPDSAYYDSVNDRVVVKKVDGDSLKIRGNKQ